MLLYKTARTTYRVNSAFRHHPCAVARCRTPRHFDLLRVSDRPARCRRCPQAKVLETVVSRQSECAWKARAASRLSRCRRRAAASILPANALRAHSHRNAVHKSSLAPASIRTVLSVTMLASWSPAASSAPSEFPQSKEWCRGSHRVRTVGSTAIIVLQARRIVSTALYPPRAPACSPNGGVASLTLSCRRRYCTHSSLTGFACMREVATAQRRLQSQ